MTRAHPRSRGENTYAGEDRNLALGSSPLTRGKHQSRRECRCRMGLIPAHAGKTWIAFDAAERSEAHPRSRGENNLHAGDNVGEHGSSPLTRGKPDPAHHDPSRPGLIPAHAGKTRRAPALLRGLGAHPRSRGENCVVH